MRGPGGCAVARRVVAGTQRTRPRARLAGGVGLAGPIIDKQTVAVTIFLARHRALTATAAGATAPPSGSTLYM
jgi:hypothetical protein